ncbi:Hypothetical predicted protein [Lecanosticta acicola]|uniref:Uncharacterized protein n=1 Tax=Lecanosticta acicola TaxID=111012 RepID=A0AAI8W1P4_9PEZI|nr:Hypothetical predicted protein [Lecanosticta acicola]
MAYSNYPRDRSPASNTFIVPSEDASDFESDAESEDINYNDRSSAKTTPEQPKPANPQGRDFIDLSREDDEDDEDEYEPMAAVPDSYQPSQLPQEPVVIDDNGNDPEDLDDEDHELVMSETSVDFVRKPEQEHPLGFLDGEPEAANEDRAAAINTGLAQFLCERHARLQERAQDKESDFAVPDYNVVAADVLSDNASEALDTSQVGVGAQVENNFWFANRPASPEPGEQSAARQPTEGARFPTSSTAPTKASKPRYDPVREEPNTSNDLPEPSQADNSFQHDFYSFAPALATHYSNAGASGWQTRSSPAVAPWHRPGLTLDALQNAYTLSSLAPRESAQSERQPERGDTAASMMGSFASKQNNEPATLGPTHASAYNGKISITQLLEEQGDALDQAHEMVKEANNATMAGFSSSGTKRKAVETEIDGHVETSAPPSKKSRPTASAQASTARTHRRRSTGRGIVRRIAEGAAGAFLGAAATVAFLSSPYAELLIDWLD